MTDPTTVKHVEVEYRDNDRVHIIHINGSRREHVDAYVEAIHSEIISREDTLLLSIHNYTSLGGMISPYFLGRIKELSQPEFQRKDLVGRVALVHPAEMFRILFNPIVNIFIRNNNTLSIQFFNELEDAVSWVSEYEQVKDPE